MSLPDSMDGVEVAAKPHLGQNVSCAARDAASLPVCHLGAGSRADGLNKRQLHGLVLLLHLPFIPINRSRRSTPLLAPSLVLFRRSGPCWVFILALHRLFCSSYSSPLLSPGSEKKNFPLPCLTLLHFPELCLSVCLSDPLLLPQWGRSSRKRLGRL